MVTVNNGIQFWTVPYSGTYQITAVGAAGGYANKGPVARGTQILCVICGTILNDTESACNWFQIYIG